MDIAKLFVSNGNSVEVYKVTPVSLNANEKAIGVKSITRLDEKWFQVEGHNKKTFFVNVDYVVEYMVDNSIKEEKAE